MKLFKTPEGIILKDKDNYFQIPDIDWDRLVDQDNLYHFLQGEMRTGLTALSSPYAESLLTAKLHAPIGKQEIWAAGVTYFRSREARIDESKDAGGGDFYDRVYAADRPELFFKSAATRAVGSGDLVNIRKDSTWNVPEPELTLFLNSGGRIQGYTIGNDMSSRSIEGENPLYLPQAKTYDRCVALGPCLYIPSSPISLDTIIYLKILRNDYPVFEGSIAINQMKRGHEELARYLFLECSFPGGCYLMTGTGIVPPNSFTLHKGDQIQITIDAIGTLINFVS
ncbi:MAG: fumarylacetoacetate hydrolase family protein [Chitinophagales bacterium]